MVASLHQTIKGLQLGKSSVNGRCSIALFEPAGGKPCQHFLIFWGGVVGGFGLVGAGLAFCRLQSHPKAVDATLLTLWCKFHHALNFFLGIPTRSWWHTLNFSVEFYNMLLTFSLKSTHGWQTSPKKASQKWFWHHGFTDHLKNEPLLKQDSDVQNSLRINYTGIDPK
jgi:hypothetical protein